MRKKKYVEKPQFCTSK